MKKKSRIDNELVMELYNKGFSDIAIGEKCGICRTGITKWRNKHHLPAHFSFKKKISFEHSLAMELYNQGLVDRDIGEKMSVSTFVISAWRKRCNLPPNRSSFPVKKDPLYPAWAGIIGRCENPKNKGYKFCGAIGITMCEDWHDSRVFITWGRSHGYEKGLCLVRKDSTKGFCPENCKFVSRSSVVCGRKAKNLFEAERGKIKNVCKKN